jgi:hypothetical protein
MRIRSAVEWLGVQLGDGRASSGRIDQVADRGEEDGIARRMGLMLVFVLDESGKRFRGWGGLCGPSFNCRVGHEVHEDLRGLRRDGPLVKT